MKSMNVITTAATAVACLFAAGSATAADGFEHRFPKLEAGHQGA
jgi:hypothetical protein